MFHCARDFSLAMLLFSLTAFGIADSVAIAAPISANPDQTSVKPSVSPPFPKRNPLRGLTELRSKLNQKDQLVALRALHLALTRVPDGGTFLWQRKSRSLRGAIKPSKAFRNADGQICRHVIYAMALGRYVKQIEGIACRRDDGSWQL
jgi:hypothetical protein